MSVLRRFFVSVVVVSTGGLTFSPASVSADTQKLSNGQQNLKQVTNTCPISTSLETKNYIIRFADNTSREEADRLLRLKQIEDPSRRFTKSFNGAVIKLNANDARDLCLLDDADLLWIEEDQNINVGPVGTQGVATVRAATVVSATSWGIDRIDQERGTNGQYSYVTDGAGVDVYVVDTGLNASHTEFSGRVKSGYSVFNNVADTTDANGHGTHVAGTAVGATLGVAPAASVIPVQVLDAAGSGTLSGVIAGIEWVIDHHTTTPAVMNLSLGATKSDSLNTAIDRAFLDGITVVAAAGNLGKNACEFSPASNVASALTVGATTTADERAPYSNFGECLDLFAPGSGITAAWHTGTTATNTISGTSMAAPHVAGLVARYLSAAPLALPMQAMDAIKADATKGVVTSAGTLSPNLLAFGHPTLTPIPPPLMIPMNPDAITATPGAGTPSAPSLPGRPSKPSTISGVKSSWLTWKETSDGGLPITGHVVQVFRKGKLVGRVVVDADELHTIAGLRAASPHTFTVAAMNALGVGPFSRKSTVVVPVKTTRTYRAPQTTSIADIAPKAPTRIRATQSKSSVDVRWSVPKNASVSSFEVLFIQNKKVVAKVVTENVGGVRVSGLTRGRYDIRVRAVNPAGSSARSKAVRLNFR